ncbi:DUF1007 family protein [Roseovarius dicentrarchi]|uniref:DUF1007 family protein n=1 Tax=Roseovarius dicentrarchi TaxID=2250573 RepID=UPI000DEB2A42|nr:DUF1007 family protein [Roseovarius dicentrarchi]
MRRALALCAAAWACAPGSAVMAHPHVFIDAAAALIVNDDGDLAALRIGWSYDAFYSLVMIEDRGLDADGDGTPEPAQLEAFAGQDVDWAAGFPGDVTLGMGGDPVPLAPPIRHRALYENGRIITTHIRPLTTPITDWAEAVTLQIYDPSYFVAYEVPVMPTVEGADCTVTRTRADTARAQAEYGDKLAAVDVSDDPFAAVDLGDIGVLFADSFSVTCAAR